MKTIIVKLQKYDDVEFWKQFPSWAFNSTYNIVDADNDKVTMSDGIVYRLSSRYPKDTPEYRIESQAGTLTDYKAVSIKIDSDDATLQGKPCKRGDEFYFASNNESGINNLEYNPNSGQIRFTILR